MLARGTVASFLDKGQSNRTANLMTLFGSSAIQRQTSSAFSKACSIISHRGNV